MKKISILFFILIGLLAINWSSVQADDEGDFEEGKFFFLCVCVFFDKHIPNELLMCVIFRCASK